MGFWDVVGLGIIGGFAIKAIHGLKEDKRRQSIDCTFDDGISYDDFEKIAVKAGKKINRVSRIYVDEAVVYGRVESQSGISEWSFKLDFNDYGHLTGRYWISSDNDDSSIPKKVGNIISATIHEIIDY